MTTCVAAVASRRATTTTVVSAPRGVPSATVRQASTLARLRQANRHRLRMNTPTRTSGRTRLARKRTGLAAATAAANATSAATGRRERRPRRTLPSASCPRPGTAKESVAASVAERRRCGCSVISPFDAADGPPRPVRPQTPKASRRLSQFEARSGGDPPPHQARLSPPPPPPPPPPRGGRRGFPRGGGGAKPPPPKKGGPPPPPLLGGGGSPPPR